ncbi:helix-turn-helix transcriptional regulator [Suttonella ornithocola]|uniref:M5 polypeptide n=1 Tax=Suttonella ornithocola TaxID=279832 RepID=A0A380MKN8_9GAMM|nr:helix-turn-helix transcriptional regulator [Suttonella ornithocola]SUO93200.1 M5 polypeptide [Suttonella ornithocola]
MPFTQSVILPSDIVSNHYRSRVFPSRIRAHGGVLQSQKARKHLCWVQPYSAFIVLLRGELRFSIGRQQYHFQKNPTVIFIYLPYPTLFVREIGIGTLEKYTFTGLENWLALPTTTKPVHAWQPSQSILEKLHKISLQTSEIEHVWQQEVALMALLDSLWQECLAYAAPKAELPIVPEVALFSKRLEQAFTQGVASVGALANALYMSERTLNRKLQQYFGISATQWLLDKRMYLAARLLAEQKSITEASYACGYQTVSGFSHAFHRYFGATPSEYLNQLLG